MESGADGQATGALSAPTLTSSGRPSESTAPCRAYSECGSGSSVQPIQQESHELLGTCWASLQLLALLATMAWIRGKVQPGAPAPTVFPAGWPSPPSSQGEGVATNHL